MTMPGPPPPDPKPERPEQDSSERRPPLRPWRTEGLPKRPSTSPRRRGLAMALGFIGYLVLFGLLTVQDRWSGPQLVAYTEFKSQVASKNVEELVCSWQFD